MNKFDIVIFKLPALYEIFNEIKSELSFNYFYFNEFNDEFNTLVSKNPQILIISSEKNKQFKNCIYFSRALNIKNLLQLINVNLSKSNYEIKSSISLANYKIDTNSRIISKGNLSLKLTEREIDLLVYLNNSKDENNRLDLQKNVWKHSANLETHTVETHIYRLRKKILDKFDDDKLIINTKNGYKLSE